MEIVWEFLRELWANLAQMAPWLLFGFLVAGALSVVISPDLVHEHLGRARGRFLPVAKAVAFGVPLPLCSCGVIPVTASLVTSGASRGAAVGFLISTPQTGVDSVVVTYSFLGPVFAVIRPLVALVSGLMGGWAVELLEPGPLRRAHAQAQSCGGGGCMVGQGRGGKVVQAISYGLGRLPEDIGKALVVGLAVAAGIATLVPENYFAGLLGPGLMPKLGMMLVGMPIYVCATASVPVAAALIAKGVAPGTALVFLMTGPATNAATFTVIWRLVGRRAGIVYLLTVGLAALGAGTLLDVLIPPAQVQAVVHPGAMLPGWLTNGAGVVLVGVLARAIWAARARIRQAREAGMDFTLKIEGMSCSHCAAAVQRAIAACEGVEEVNVELASGTATVKGNADPAKLAEAVEQVGYKVVETRSIQE